MTTDKVVKSEEIKIESVSKKSRFFLSRKDLCIPYAVFLLMFVIIPLFFILAYAFTDGATGKFTFSNFAKFFTNTTSITTLLISIGLALATTAICLLMAYPIAYILARTNLNRTGVMLMLFIMPMWINFTLRALSMMELLTLIHLFNKAPFLNILIGMVYDFMPFMILPLYTTLSKMDRSYEEAAADLGANKVRVFFKVTLPLSMPGIISGITMVFLPTMTWYVISDAFGRYLVPIIGRLIQDQFGTAHDWNYGSALALIMLVIMFVVMLVTGEFKGDKENGGRTL